MKIVFGTSSKWRKKFFPEFGVDYEIMSADIDEKAIRFSDPKELTIAIAKAKAVVLLDRIKEDVILITFDQVVVCNGVIYEKPQDAKELRSFWKSYALHPAQTFSAVVVTDSISGYQLFGVDIASTFFDPIPEEVLEKIVADENMYTSSGGFMVNYPLTDPYIRKIEGTLDSIEGIPLELTKSLILEVNRRKA